jgi:hypothetical protein
MRSKTVLVLAALLAGCQPSKPPAVALKLDRQVIETLGSSDLASKAEDEIDSMPESKGGSDDWILVLPQQWRAVYTALLLDGEVNNGGFHQYFWNYEGKFNDATLADLK